MSIIYCHYHMRRIDTDYEAEHFIDGTEICADYNHNRNLNAWEASEESALDFKQMEKDRKLHKECTAKKCVAGKKHIESCHDEIIDSNISNINTNPF